jgi:hypothetical protein
VVLVGGYTAVRWLISGASAIELQDDLRLLQLSLMASVPGAAVVCACAGWATFAPAGDHRFAPSLLFVFLASLGLWLLLSQSELTPRRLKNAHQPAIYPSELAILIGPPIAAAVVLGTFRAACGGPGHRPGPDPDRATSPGEDGS